MRVFVWGGGLRIPLDRGVRKLAEVAVGLDGGGVRMRAQDFRAVAKVIQSSENFDRACCKAYFTVKSCSIFWRASNAARTAGVFTDPRASAAK